ncbi:MAG: 4-hydroxy-tetrahydrodipicolinate reductase [Firmicutes bacterium]|nr:4-hydroxy-tetrahydrodipicolinate reductase [Bacillota bacterium]
MRLTVTGTGMMGSLIYQMAEENPAIEKVTAVEPVKGESLFDVEIPDVIIDFSHPDALTDICRFVQEGQGRTGVVFGTTGFTEEQLAEIRKLARIAPVIQSYNYSYGIQTMKKLLACARPMLDGRADMEIIEKHHNLKTDVPSGTALMLAGICDPEHCRRWLTGRNADGKRGKELGIHSLRGGTIFGEHSVIYAMEDEVIEITHTAFSKRIFAKGAIEAALWLNGRKPGIYTIEDVFY